MSGATEADVKAMAQSTSALEQRIEHGHVVRDDIQLLRGVAVLSVFLYHADKDLLAGGFLGVDVFFVISGFLITRNIIRNIERGSFSYASFIARRFRRLLPACYAMLVFSTVLASLFLTRQDMAEFVRQTLGTLSFSSNFVLWRQSGYFDTSSSLKLLLHTWSLSLEEQYYLFLPLILYFGARHNTLKLLVILFTVSLLACLVGVSYKPSAAFYLLPFRAWELLAGSLCAVLMLRRKAPIVRMPMKAAALGVLLLTMVFPPTAMHPGPGALLVVLSTALLLVGGVEYGRSPLARGMYFFGDISYSLYLFHWPLIAVANHVYADAVPIPAMTALMASALGLSYLSFRLVEQPFRNATTVSRCRVFALAIGIGALIMLFTSGLYVALGSAPGLRVAGNAPNYGLGRACAFDANFVAQPECQSSATPSVLLWGDSYAMHLANALDQQQRFGFVQATKSLCGPVTGVAPVTGTYNDAWAQDCLSFNDSVLHYLEAQPGIRLVILGSKWRQYFHVEKGGRFLVRRNPDAIPERLAELDRRTVESNVHALITRITSSGRKVLFVQPPPSADFDVYRCLQRKRQGLLYIGASDGCQIDETSAALRDAGLAALLRSLAPMEDVYSYSFNALLCDGGKCRTELDGVTLYRDEGHFSAQGSRILGRQSGLNSLVGRLLIDHDD